MRVQVRLTLTLKGKRADGTDFEIRVSTENVSKSGFLCVSATPLDDTQSVEVFLLGKGNHRLGNARLVRVANSSDMQPRYGFQFTGMWTTPLINVSSVTPQA